MKNDHDIARLGYLVENYTDIKDAGTTRAYTNLVNGKDKAAKTVALSAEISEKNYVLIEAVPDTNNKTIWIESMYSTKKEATQSVDTYSPDETSGNATENTSVYTISQPAEKVKSPAENKPVEQPSVKPAEKEIRRIGGELTDESGRLTRETRSVLEYIAKLLGVDIKVVDRIENGALGKYSLTDSAQNIMLALAGNDNPAGTFVHETVHMIKALSKSDYLDLYTYGMKYLTYSTGKSNAQIISEIKEKYKKTDRSFPPPRRGRRLSAWRMNRSHPPKT